VASRYVVINGRRVIDPRSTRAWRRLVAQVIREEPRCWLRLSGCTVVSTTGDHVVPVTKRPDLALVRANVRGACRPCNEARGSLPIEELRVGDELDDRPALRIFDA
jgi:5-methylcytosine-specific restriction endonuclease McrA